VYPVHELVTNGETEVREIASLCLSAQIGCADCKQRLVNSIAGVLGPFQERRAEPASEDEYIKECIT
jgi:tryptophanyl-tRNA synthetase